MSTFLATLISYDNGASPPTALPGEQVIDHFLSRQEQKDNPKLVAQIAEFMGRAELGDWRTFEGLGMFSNKDLVITKVRSDKQGIKPGRRR